MVPPKIASRAWLLSLVPDEHRHRESTGDRPRSTPIRQRLLLMTSTCLLATPRSPRVQLVTTGNGNRSNLILYIVAKFVCRRLAPVGQGGAQ
jgi:hypothetical protein